MNLERDILGLRNLAARVRDLVLGSLVPQLEEATAIHPRVSDRTMSDYVGRDTYRLGSMVLPSALFLSFFMARGPMFLRWSALGFVMMVSQMTAELVALAPAAAGQSAVT